MPTPDESTVRRVLEKDDRDIRCREAIEQAWRFCLSNYPDRAWWRRKSTTAHVMWEKSVDNVIAALEGDEGATVLPHEDTTSFILDDTVLVRLKRAKISLLSQNYPTPLAGLFHRHTADLFGFEGHHRIELVHVFDRFQGRLDWIGIVAREKNRVLWNFELRRGGAAIIELPLAPAPAPAADTVLRQVPPADEEKRDEEES